MSDKGILTDAEFAEQKAELLGGNEDQQSIDGSGSHSSRVLWLVLVPPLLLAMIEALATCESESEPALQEQNLSGWEETQEPQYVALPLYCRDSTNTNQPFAGVDTDKLTSALKNKLGLDRAHVDENLVFTKGTEKITFVTEPYEDGLVLKALEIRQDGVVEHHTGTEMCWVAWSLVHILSGDTM